MSSAAEVFKAEVLARMEATPDDYPEPIKRIRRSHLTAVTREEAPAIYCRFGDAKRTGSDGCNWTWELEWTVSVYVRSDNDADSDPIVLEVVRRMNPLPGGAPFANKVVPDIKSIRADTEINDKDAQRVDVRGVAVFNTPAWNLERE